jgi:hypothetical protein
MLVPRRASVRLAGPPCFGGCLEIKWGAPFTQGGAALALGWYTSAPLERLDTGSTGRWPVSFGGLPKPLPELRASSSHLPNPGPMPHAPCCMVAAAVRRRSWASGRSIRRLTPATARTLRRQGQRRRPTPHQGTAKRCAEGSGGFEPTVPVQPNQTLRGATLECMPDRFQASLRDAISTWACRQPWAEAHGYRQVIAPRQPKPALDTPTGCQPSGKVHGANRAGASEPIADWQFADRSLHLPFRGWSVAHAGIDWGAPAVGRSASAACRNHSPSSELRAPSSQTQAPCSMP